MYYAFLGAHNNGVVQNPAPVL